MLERFSNSDIWLTYVLIGIFIGIVSLKQINSYRFLKLIKLGWTSEYIKHILTTPKKDTYFSGLLIFLSCLCFSLFYKIYKVNYLFEEKNFELELFFKTFIFLSIYLFVKYIIQKIIGYVFQINKIISQYLCFKYSLLYYIGILVYIPLLMMVYANLSSYYLTVIFGVFASFYVLRIIFFYLKFRSLISNHLFYFILYICSFEIIPIFFLIRYME